MNKSHSMFWNINSDIRTFEHGTVDNVLPLDVTKSITVEQSV